MNPDLLIGQGPLLLAQPHGGIEIPESIRAKLNPRGLAMADTDWHITQLYAGLVEDVTIVSTPIHRYVIDANRDPADVSLYPGQNTTSLCPTTDFDGEDIYLVGQQPSADEIAQRQIDFHQPYHQMIRQQLDRIHQKHGFAILYDCHSIRSHVPFLFDGQLPGFNIGTNSGASCDAKIEADTLAICQASADYKTVLNGRFKGGWTTRHYGQPEKGFHAIQMELSQHNYMLEQAPWSYDKKSAEKLRVALFPLIKKLSVWTEDCF